MIEVHKRDYVNRKKKNNNSQDRNATIKQDVRYAKLLTPPI